MKISRPIRILIWVLVLAICLFIKYYDPDYLNNFKYARIVSTLLQLSTLLLIFRIAIDGLILWYKLEQGKSEKAVKDNLIVGLTNVYTIVAVGAILLAILYSTGIDIRGLFTTLSIVAAAIAVVTKDFIAEIIVGVINGFSTKIELDDYIEINNMKGKIIDIGLQKITLLNDEDDLIYIPNVKFYNSEIINYTRKDIRRMGVDFQLDLKYMHSVEELEKQLAKACDVMDNFIEPDSFNLKVMNISKDTIDLKFQYTMKEVRRETHRQIRKLILRRVANLVGSSE
ncbi:MAG: mechanosensitive ion channel [Saprospiraceae bacterium]|nr:mechanosensitive ion channel [Saprospiraceae bacterium]